jgi:ribosome-binding factor A
MSHRLKRINELLKREISALFQKDFVFGNALVTLNAVEIAPDLKNATVFVGILGSEKDRERALNMMVERRGFIQSRIAKRVVLRETPHLSFRCDDSVERGSQVLSIMDQIEIPEELPPDTGELK